MEVVVRDADTETVLHIIAETARTGSLGDGKIFVMPVAEALRVRTGERGEGAV